MFPWSRKQPTHQAVQWAEFLFQSTASLVLSLYQHSAGPLYTNLVLMFPITLSAVLGDRLKNSPLSSLSGFKSFFLVEPEQDSSIWEVISPGTNGLC